MSETPEVPATKRRLQAPQDWRGWLVWGVGALWLVAMVIACVEVVSMLS
jgi:hypothetical protein